MTASNSIYAAVQSMATMCNHSTLLVMLDNDNASSNRFLELEFLPQDAAFTAWDESLSVTPLTDDVAQPLVEAILHDPDVFPEQTTFGLRMALFFHPKAPQQRDGIIGLYFEQDHGGPRRILHLRSLNDLDEPHEADDLAA